MKKCRSIYTALIVLLFVIFHYSTGMCSDVHQTPDEPPFLETFVFECADGTTFTARIEEDDAWLFLPGKTEKLTIVPSASGVKYSHGSIVFWAKGEEALLQLGEDKHTACKNNRAKAIWEDAKFGGVDFRAVGNEPGWHLEIVAGEEIFFVTDYGNAQYAFATPEPFTEKGTKKTIYDAKDARHKFTVEIEGQPCNDTMSGELFETAVTVTLDNKIYHGCGKALH